MIKGLMVISKNHRLGQLGTEKHSLSTQQKMGSFFQSRKDKTAKGEEWNGLHFA